MNIEDKINGIKRKAEECPIVHNFGKNPTIVESIYSLKDGVKSVTEFTKSVIGESYLFGKDIIHKYTDILYPRLKL
jgi:hypothetical protein